MTMVTYNGFKITTTPPNVVKVFDVRFKRDPALYQTTSLDKAMKWVDAYRDGHQWALDALDQRADARIYGR